MTHLAFRIVNVFAQMPLAGNPLAVFEDARGLDDATMQALALQFNLSETTFVLPSQVFCWRRMHRCRSGFRSTRARRSEGVAGWI
jgi:predicted PhzF superfamily epimerase YddE/YHI9